MNPKCLDSTTNSENKTVKHKKRKVFIVKIKKTKYKFQKNIQLRKFKIQENITLFLWASGWDLTESVKIVTNAKSGNIK